VGQKKKELAASIPKGKGRFQRWVYWRGSGRGEANNCILGQIVKELMKFFHKKSDRGTHRAVHKWVYPVERWAVMDVF